MKFGQRLFAAFLASTVMMGYAVPAYAMLIRKADSADPSSPSPASESGSKPSSAAGGAAKAEGGSKGAFTGSTALSQFLFQKFNSNPISVSVPKSKLGKGGMKTQIDKLDDAAHEAFLQNGQMEHVTRFNYTYYSDRVGITVSYSNRNVTDRKARGKAVAGKAKAIAASVATEGMTDLQKATALYDYMAANVAYDYEALDDYFDKESGAKVYTRQTAYSALVQNRAICQGYAKAYKLLCDQAGVPCVVVFGTTKRPGGGDAAHAWNRIWIDGAWRTVDTSNALLHICTPQGIFVPASAAGLYLPNNQTLVDAQAAQYTG